MTCSICRKSAAKQYYLCDCCFMSLERCCNATANNLSFTRENPVSIIPKEEDTEVQTIECDLCLGKFQENELLQHRERCTILMVFRCAVCHQDYMSKDGLWSHLNLHKVADENKQMMFTEVRVAHSLLKCVLCNDQRGYQERLYWQHIHEDHDGFFLQCSECGESFRSQKLLTDHTFNHCNGREQAVPSHSNGTSTEQIIIDDDSDMEDDKSKLDLDKLLYDHATGETSQPMVEKISSDSTGTKCPHCDKECLDKTLLAQHIKNHHPPTECETCGKTFASVNQARYHRFKHRTIQKHKYHLSKHLNNSNFQSEIRQPDQTATILPDFEAYQEREKHQEQGSDENLLQDPVEFIAIKEEISAEEATLQEEQEYSEVADANLPNTITQCPICGGMFGNRDENHLSVHVELIHQLYICTSCAIIFPTSDQLRDHACPKRNYNCNSNSDYASSISTNLSLSSAAAVFNPSYLADEDASNGSSFDGWEVHSTVPVKDMESYVMSIEYGFRYKSQNIPAKGKMRYYDCRRVKCRVFPQCERKLLAFIPSNDAEAVATISLRGRHSCTNAQPDKLARTKLIGTDYELIINLLKSGVPARDVKQHLKALKGGISDNQLKFAMQVAKKTVKKWRVDCMSKEDNSINMNFAYNQPDLS